MAPPPTYNPDSVIITLRSTSSTAHQTRNITLRPDEPVNVGRSSRSEAKNLSATANNALFDCPVISRRHAELELKVNKWTQEKYQVYISDTGSMHGTSVNGQKLQPSKPFQLQPGDVVRLGDSVNRADNNYDGVTVTLDFISTATKQKNSAPLKSNRQGISVPSDSESEFDDDNDDSEGGADVQPSSSHTTPDKTNANSGSQAPVKTASSPTNVITLEDDDDDDEPIPLFSRRATAHSIVIPDTFADDTHMVPDTLATEYPAPAAVPRSPLHFGEKHVPNEKVADIAAAMAAVDATEAVLNGDEASGHEHANSEHSWSDQDHVSDYGQDSDVHSDSQEYLDRQSFLSEDFDMADDVEDDEDDEGPEIMSSKRRLSNELGTLGDEPNQANPVAIETIFPTRPHYDPVRGFQVPAPSVDKTPAYRSYDPDCVPPHHHDLFADFSRSNKWDVEPSQAPETQGFHSFATNFNPFDAPLPYGNMTNWKFDSPSAYFEKALPLADTVPRGLFDLDTTSIVPSNSPTDAFVEVVQPSSKATEHNTKKRKAPEMTDEFSTTPASETPVISEETTEAVDAATITPTEPHSKKRKIKQLHPEKSLLRTAVIEAGKYTAGAIIGGIGLVTILASPIGEALASC